MDPSHSNAMSTTKASATSFMLAELGRVEGPAAGYLRDESYQCIFLYESLGPRGIVHPEINP